MKNYGESMNRTINAQERRRVRIESRREFMRLVDEALSAKEIAARLNCSVSRVHRRAARLGIQIGKQSGTGRIGAFVPRPLIDNVSAIAKAAGVSNSAMVARTIKAVFADPAIARRVLGKDALPVRGYRVEG